MNWQDSVVTASKHRNEVQQMHKQIEDAQIQTHRGSDVVGLAAADDAACVEKN